MKFKITSIILLIVLIISFSGCDFFSVNLSPESLMVPPKLSKEQEEIYAALEKYAGKVTIKYPQTGNYRSAFIMYDIDSDGFDEAIVFYALSAEQPLSSYSRINILDNINGTWESVCNFAGQGLEVDHVDFINMESLDRINLVVGWDMGNQDDKEIVVYDYKNNSLTKKYSGAYTKMELLDITKDNLCDIVLVNSSYGTARPKLSLISQKNIGNIDLISEVTLKGPITEYNSIKMGNVNSTDVGLFIDVSRGADSYFTEVVSFENGNLINKTFSEDVDYSLETYRDFELLCQDVNGDGIIEVPNMTVLPGYNSTYSQRLFLTTWKQVVDSQFSVISSSFVDEKYKFTLTFPERWVGKVTAIRYPETKELIFYEYNSEDPDNTSNTLLSINLFSKNDLKDEYEIEGYSLAGQNNYFDYYYKISDNISDLSITADEFGSIFSISK